MLCVLAADDDLLPSDPAAIVVVVIGNRDPPVQDRPGEDDLEPRRVEAAGPERVRERAPDGDERGLPSVDGEVGVARRSASRRRARRCDRPGTSGSRPDPGRSGRRAAVPEISIRLKRLTVKLPSGCADASAGQRERARAASASEHEPLHRSAFLATGAHRIEKCGLSASARAGTASRRRAVAEAALDHPAVEELERIARAEPERAAASRGAPRRSGRCGRAPRRARRRRRSIGRSAWARRASASACGSRTPWSTSKSAVSRSVLTPFATSSRWITPISAYCRRGELRSPAAR